MIAVVLYGVILIVLFGARAFDPSVLLYGDDIHRSYWFIRTLFRDAIQSGTFPWWNPYTFSGSPFAANVITNPFYPPNWLYVILPLPTAYIAHVEFHLLLAMGGMYFFIKSICSQFAIPKKQLTVHRKTTYFRQLIHVNFELASFTAGVVYGLSGFFMARLYAGHVDVIAACAWIPWVFLMFYRLFTTYTIKAMVVAAIILSCQLFSGYQTMAFFTLEGVGIMAFIFGAHQRSVRPLVLMVGSIILAIGLSACSLVPIQQLVSLSIRSFPRSYEWVTFGSLPWESLKQFLFPFQYGNQWTYTGPPPNFPEQAFFVGRVSVVVIVMVFIWGCRRILRSVCTVCASVKQRYMFRCVVLNQNLRDGLTKRTSPRTLSSCFDSRFLLLVIFFSILLFGLWVSMSSYVPIDLQKVLWTLVPMYKVLRIPTRHLILVVFSASVLVGLGLTIVKEKWIKLLLSLAIIIEMFWYGSQFIDYKETPDMRNDQSVMTFFKSEKTLVRILPNYGCWLLPRDAYDFDAPLRDKTFSATGYDPTIYRPYYEFIDAANGATTPSIYQHDVQVPYIDIKKNVVDFLNIKYLMVPTDADPLYGKGDFRYKLIKEDLDKQYRIYEHANVLPRFYFVPEAKGLNTRDDIATEIRKGVDFSTTVLVDLSKAQSLHSSMQRCDSAVLQQSEVTVVSYGLNTIVLTTNTPCDAYLVSSEVMYPGWVAYVDGKKTEMIEGNLAFRTLFVPKGVHTVTMVFEPTIFMIGWGITVLTVGLVVVLVLKH